MDPNILSIILGLITNGLTSLVTTSGKKMGDLLVGQDFLKKWELEKTSLSPILSKAITNVAENVLWEEGGEEIIALFLRSPEVEDLVRQLYSVYIADPGTETNFTSLRKIFHILLRNFIACYSNEVTHNHENLAKAAEYLFDALIEGCNCALKEATDKGILSANEAMNTFQNNIIYSEIKAIQKKLDFFIAQQEIDVRAILDFERVYRKQIADRHGYITPPNFDAARKLPVDNLYVCPNFLDSSKKDDTKVSLSLDSFLTCAYRAVLLGNPGAGKSTLTLKLCYDLSTKYSQRLFGTRRELTPILVVLRNYGVEKKQRRCSIREFIETEVEATYQLPIPPEGAIEYLLLNGRAIVIFDGLDELLDTGYRQEIRDDVQSFCNIYPSVPILVTSRVVGYEQAPLNENIFEVFRLEPFNDNQIQEYVQKWFMAIDVETTHKIRQQKIKSFLLESRNVSDLRSNPLMLALMCNIYLGENYIPRNRPDVYEKCATMLFERWDRGRNIQVPLPFEAHIRPTMMYLAYWIYTNEILRAGVTERKLVIKASEYLHQKRFEDLDEAQQAAREFIEFCKGRAWVFTDTGTEKEGERLYQFTHQTFLEYFTAAYLVRTHPTSEALIAGLLPRIAMREWDVVAQLAFQIQNRNSEDAGDELLMQLLIHSNEADEKEWWNILSFAIRCLKFIIPTPKVTREITKTFVQRLLLHGSELLNTTIKGKIPRDSRPNDLLQELKSSASENLPTIVDSLEKLLAETIQGSNDPRCLAALELNKLVTSVLGHEQEENSLWESMSKRINNTYPQQLEMAYSKSPYLCLGSVWMERVSFAKFAEWHGAEKLFQDFQSCVLPNWSVSSIALGILRRFPHPISSDEDERWLKRDLRLLKDVGLFFLNHSLNRWEGQYQIQFDEQEMLQLRERLLRTSKDLKLEMHIDADEAFGLFIIFAILSELRLSEKQKVIDFLLNTKDTKKYSFLKIISLILSARNQKNQNANVQTEIEKYHFSQKQLDFVWGWTQQEINLVAPERIQNNNED